MKHFYENIKTPVQFETKVAVAGGGIAGIAAALAAARHGKKVILIEKQCILGGLATAGLIAVYLPLCDGMGHQVSFGIAEELLKLSVQEGRKIKYPEAWFKNSSVEEKKKERYEVQFNPQMFALLLEELLLSYDVKILYDTKICGVHVENNKIQALIIENKSGRSAVAAENFVDATGDADIFWYGGAPTFNHVAKNRVAAWYYYNTSKSGTKLKILGECDSAMKENENLQKKIPAFRYSGLDGEENSRLLYTSHSVSLKDIRESRRRDVSYEPVTLATMPQVRMTRRFSGVYTLKEQEKNVHFADSIGMVADWRKKGAVYEIPFRCLYADKIENLIGAGRCVSVDEGMWDISRVIPGCAVTGEAAGTAASLCCDFRSLSVHVLQDALRHQGQKITFQEAGL